MTKITLPKIFHVLGIAIWIFVLYCIFRVTQLDIVPWLHRTIIFIGPGMLYLFSLFQKKRNNLSYIVFVVCSFLYCMIAVYAVNSSEAVRSLSEFLLIPIFIELHFVFYFTFNSDTHFLKKIEITLFLLSSSLCMAVLFFEPHLILYIFEIIVLIFILGIKINRVNQLKNFSETSNS